MNSNPIIIALQGRMMPGSELARDARLDEIAEAIGGRWQLLNPHPHDWQAALPGNSLSWGIMEGLCGSRIYRLASGSNGPIILLGHSDGGTMAVRLAVTLRKRIAAVVAYAAVYDHWKHHEDACGDSLPPALFLNNDHDSLVDPQNVQRLQVAWSAYGRSNLDFICGPSLPEVHHLGDGAALATHLWQPDAANPIVVEWLRGVLV